MPVTAGGGGSRMSEDLETTLRRMTETKVNRRGFLYAAGLTGAAAAIAACTPGSGSSPAASTGGQRRSRRERRPERGPERCRGGQLPAGRRHRKRAVHVQLERVHLAREHRGVQGQVRHHQVPVRHLRQQRRPAGQAPGRRDRLRHRVADGRVRARHGRAGLRPEARQVAAPEPGQHRPEVQGPVVGSQRRVPDPEGLRDDRRPLSHDDDPDGPARAGRTSWS